MLTICMVGWVALLFVVAQSQASRLAPGTALSLVSGVNMTVPGGWSEDGQQSSYGVSGKALRKSGTLLVVSAQSYADSAGTLLKEQLALVRSHFAYFRAVSSSVIALAGGRSAQLTLFAATADGITVSGELATATVGDWGLVMLATSAPKERAGVQADLDSMLGSLTDQQAVAQ